MERKVPVLRTDSSLIEQEFDSIRDKFELEMRKMEEEMSRFRLQLIESERSRLVSSSSSSSRSQTTTSSSSSRMASSNVHQEQEVGGQAQSSIKTSSSSTAGNKLTAASDQHDSSWLHGLNSPLIISDETSGNKVLKLRFDVTPYEPEQIIVKTIENRLQIHARREERNENTSMYREYNREFLLPQGINPELIRSSLSADGVLTVEAPLPVAK